ncbi:MAG: hypothetical protein AB7F86_18025 [Bdellovibrionales bacterium]
MKALIIVLTLFSSLAFAKDKRKLMSALEDIQVARQHLDRAEMTIYELLTSESDMVVCTYRTTGSWKGEFTGEGATENEARNALVDDCMAKYPGPKEIVCRDLRGASAVRCR